MSHLPLIPGAAAIGVVCLLAASDANAARGAFDALRVSHESVRLAYLDPGSGSFMVQALIAGLAGIGVAGRRYWSQIKSWLGLGSPDEGDELDPDDD